jgi:hypothetical protein
MSSNLKFVVIMLALILMMLVLAYFVIPGSGPMPPAPPPVNPGLTPLSNSWNTIRRQCRGTG